MNDFYTPNFPPQTLLLSSLVSLCLGGVNLTTDWVSPTDDFVPSLWSHLPCTLQTQVGILLGFEAKELFPESFRWQL